MGLPARFLQPIFCIKKYNNVLQNGVCGSIQLTSFQSTSSCNIIHVNAINSCALYASVKERGRGASKRQWGIEMNESRRLYLNSYGAIDKLDHLIENCNMSYRYVLFTCFFFRFLIFVYSQKNCTSEHGSIGMRRCFTLSPWLSSLPMTCTRNAQKDLCGGESGS